MPSGVYNAETRYCRICKKKLRPLKNDEDWPDRKYHITCFRELIGDIHNYNRICFNKYNHKKFVNGRPANEPLPPEGITITFD